ncbi:sodium/proton antiporter complex Mrp, protein C [Syntrophotalea carbinolica DSM 2380]|uniref:Sodium/proton antiporter complex Mrp, protein C n=1 Tax=Syntrophotalea carbinolica (strain DSM 2380 / NBRC 103641 / GraBd1) TaxID=338963 RepID=Q3A199_SYNC1|nr:NADH-quinone oxidoreductase subunit K [Syntrophotalea carbinolica]ABA89858.1 sodium/proton antiporter complex Mrp, protein C [Syntrophotalea carbinolica DSM 2380]
MIWAIALALGAVVAAGTYLAFSRDLLRCLVGLALLGNGINLLLFSSGRFIGSAPPIIDPEGHMAGMTANPLPQALVLTAIVISFALLCFSLVLAVRLIEQAGSDDVSRLRAAEPPASDPVKPPLEETP